MLPEHTEEAPECREWQGQASWGLKRTDRLEATGSECRLFTRGNGTRLKFLRPNAVMEKPGFTYVPCLLRAMANGRSEPIREDSGLLSLCHQSKPSGYLPEVTAVKVPRLTVKGQGWLTSTRGGSAESLALCCPVALEILKHVAAVTAQLGFKFCFNFSYFKVKN